MPDPSTKKKVPSPRLVKKPALITKATRRPAKGKWPVAIPRPIEMFAAALPLFALLFIPIVLGMKYLYPWAGTAEMIVSQHGDDHNNIVAACGAKGDLRDG